MDATIWFNPDCSKCRGSLDLLAERGVDATVVRYLDEPPTADQIRAVLRLLGVGARALLRTDEPAYAEAGLADMSLDDGAVIDAMVRRPILIQRPIVIANGKAVIGRPPEKVLSIL